MTAFNFNLFSLVKGTTAIWQSSYSKLRLTGAPKCFRLSYVWDKNKTDSVFYLSRVEYADPNDPNSLTTSIYLLDNWNGEGYQPMIRIVADQVKRSASRAQRVLSDHYLKRQLV